MTEHDEIERLIPWYVNGTLNETEMDLVNRHLRSCRRCTASVQAEVVFARKLRAEPAGLGDLAGTAEAWSAFAARLPRRRPSAARVWRTKFSRPSTPAAPAAALLSLMLVVAGGSFLAGQQLQRPEFQAMTTSSTYDGPVVQIVFEPDVPEHRIRRVVLESGGTVISGPTATGIYRIGLPAGSDAGVRVAQLRRLPAIRWVSLEEA